MMRRTSWGKKKRGKRGKKVKKVVKKKPGPKKCWAQGVQGSS